MYKMMKCTNQLVLIETLPAILPDLIIIQFALKYNIKNAANCYESGHITQRASYCQSYSLVGHSSFQTSIMPHGMWNRCSYNFFYHQVVFWLNGYWEYSPFSSPCCGPSYRWHPALASRLRTVQDCPLTLERIPHLGWQTAEVHLHSSLRASRNKSVRVYLRRCLQQLHEFISKELTENGISISWNSNKCCMISIKDWLKR